MILCSKDWISDCVRLFNKSFNTVSSFHSLRLVFDFDFLGSVSDAVESKICTMFSAMSLGV